MNVLTFIGNNCVRAGNWLDKTVDKHPAPLYVLAAVAHTVDLVFGSRKAALATLPLITYNVIKTLKSDWQYLHIQRNQHIPRTADVWLISLVLRMSCFVNGFLFTVIPCENTLKYSTLRVVYSLGIEILNRLNRFVIRHNRTF